MAERLGYVTTWINGRRVNEIDVNKFEGFIDDTTKHWEECSIGLIPQRCAYSNKLLLPFSKATQRILIHVSDKGLYSKRFYASSEEAIIANLRMD